MAQQVSLWSQSLRQPFVLVGGDRTQMPHLHHWVRAREPSHSPRDGYISEMLVLSLGICVPDFPHLKNLFRRFWKLYFARYI